MLSLCSLRSHNTTRVRLAACSRFARSRFARLLCSLRLTPRSPLLTCALTSLAPAASPACFARLADCSLTESLGPLLRGVLRREMLLRRRGGVLSTPLLTQNMLGPHPRRGPSHSTPSILAHPHECSQHPAARAHLCACSHPRTRASSCWPRHRHARGCTGP